MEIITKPLDGALDVNFAGNLPDIEITSDGDVSLDFKHKVDGVFVSLFTETYTPDSDGNITIEIRELIESMLELNIPPTDEDTYHQVAGYRVFQLDFEEIDADPESTEQITFTAIKGGFQNYTVDDTDFALFNWLTWQERTKYVKASDPNFLTYFAAVERHVFITIYEPSATNEINKFTLAAGQLTTINCNWERITDSYPNATHVDVYIKESSTPLTFQQRFVLTEEYFEHEDLFVFANSVGGIDTIRFTGVLTESQQFSFESAIFSRQEREYFHRSEESFQKNTGLFRTRRQLLWSRDFFASKFKYWWTLGVFFRVITQSENLSSTLHRINNYTFGFRLSEPKVYQDYLKLNPSQVSLGPTEQYIKVPEGEYVLTEDGDQLIFE
ncbi:MAG: hypothetical protein ABJG41_01250 [Cyclobacteriaceae bacterium]